jgi:hypothetical protein
MKFLIQTINNEIKHDFCFTLIETIDYNNWFYNNNDLKYILSDKPNIENCIPIGTVEFVSQYLKSYYNKEPKPINVPSELFSYYFTKRNIFNGTEKDIKEKCFVKSNDKIKSFTEICSSAPIGNYQISDVIDIVSEYRVFVYKKELIGLQNYSGDFLLFPNVNTIYDMIECYDSQPIAYTLDIAITKNGNTVVIEVHDFFSCGLYGFNNSKLPYMFLLWFNEFTKK